MISLNAIKVVLVTIFLSTAIWLLSGSGASFTQKLENIQFDWLINLNHQYNPQEGFDSIVFIDIDEQSLIKNGPWPWSRYLLSSQFKKLFDQYEIQTLALDILFSQQRSANQDSFNADLLLAELIAKESVVTAIVFDWNNPIQTGWVPLGWSFPPELTQSADSSHFPQAKGAVSQFFEFARASKGVGHINPIIDADGTIRRINPWIKYNQEFYPSLSYAIYFELMGLSPQKPPSSASAWKFFEKQGMFASQPKWINYQSYEPVRYSWQALQQDQIPSKALQNKIVLIGSSAVGMADIVNVPGHGQLPGVLIHAYVLESLLNQTQITPATFTMTEQVLLFVLLFIIVQLFSTRGFYTVLVLCITTLIAVNGYALYQFYSLQAYMPTLLFNMMLGWLFLWAANLRYVQLQKTSQNIERNFQFYVPDSILRQLLSQSQQSDPFKAQKRNITVLFVDLVGFTSLAERLSPEMLLTLNKKLLNLFSEIILQHEGTIDKYMGDSVMAFWNAPLDVSDHPQKAVDAAIQMIQALQQEWQQNTLIKQNNIQLGIGINTGESIVGNTGSDIRHSYSALGDVVNIASRLESLTRSYPTEILLGKETTLQINHPVQSLGFVNVKGKNKPIEIFTLSKYLKQEPPIRSEVP